MRAFLLPALALLATGSCLAQNHGCSTQLKAVTVNSMSSPVVKGTFSYALVVKNLTKGPVMFVVEAGQITGRAEAHRTATVGANDTKTVVFGSGAAPLKMSDMQIAYDVRHSGPQPYVLIKDCK